MDETDLIRRLRDEEADATSYHSSELANEQTTALERYFGRPFGTEKADRSQVVTPDVMDAINWALPGMLRPFLSSEDFLTVDTKAGFDTAVAADYLSHIFFTDNPGQQILEVETKLLTHAIRIAAFNTITALARDLRVHTRYSRAADEAHHLRAELASHLPAARQGIVAHAGLHA